MSFIYLLFYIFIGTASLITKTTVPWRLNLQDVRTVPFLSFYVVHIRFTRYVSKLRVPTE